MEKGEENEWMVEEKEERGTYNFPFILLSYILFKKEIYFWRLEVRHHRNVRFLIIWHNEAR